MKNRWMRLMALTLLVSIGSGGVWIFSQQVAGDKRESRVYKEQFRRAEKALATQEARLLRIPGVVGIGIGMTKRGDQPAIHVFVNVKAAGGKIPAAIPKQIDKVPVRVIETAEIKAR